MDKLDAKALVEHLRESADTLEDECRADGDWEVYRSVAAKSRATADLIEAQQRRIIELEAELDAMREGLGDAFGNLTYIFECGEDDADRMVAKESADKIAALLTNKEPQA